MILAQTAYHLGLQWGVGEKMARLFHAFDYWANYYGIDAPEILSGYRSPEGQASLRRQWDLGNRKGIAVRPARKSKHTERKALDLKPTPYLSWYGMIAAYYGYGWGGDFRGAPDPGHFFTD